MIITKVLGQLDEKKINPEKLDKVSIDWFDCDKKILRKSSESGLEIGIRLDETRRLMDGDILYEDESRVIAVEIVPVDAITFTGHHSLERVKFSYLVGNRHAPLFLEGEKMAIPYDEPMFLMLKGKGFHAHIESIKLQHLLEGHSHHEH